MKRSFRARLVALAAAVCLLVSLFPLTLHAEDTKTYLALGDSISGGYGLAAPEECFVSLVTAALGADYRSVNLATNEGETTATLLADLQSPSFRTEVAEAALITVTIGGNDLMDLLYRFLSDSLGMEQEALKQALIAGDQTVLEQTAALINEQGFVPAEADLASLEANIAAVADAIRTLNPTATLVLTTQYNPYLWLAAQASAFSALLTGSTKALAESIVKLSDTIETTLARMNGAIRAGAADGGYRVADSYAVFAASADNLCNAAIQVFPAVAVNLDFHPNKAGHTAIAAQVLAVLTASDCDHTGSSTAPTCEEGALCSVCSQPLEALGHDYAATLTADAATHYYACSRCDSRKEEAAHSSSGAATEEAAETCTVCGYQLAPKLPHTHAFDEQAFDGTDHWSVCACGGTADRAAHSFVWQTDRPATDSEDGLQHEACACGATRSEGTVLPRTPAESEGTSVVIWIALGAVVLVGGGTATLLLLRKKRS